MRLENKQVFVDASFAELVGKDVTNEQVVGTQVKNDDKGFVPVWYVKQKALAARQVKAVAALELPLKKQVARDAVAKEINTVTTVETGKQEEITMLPQVLVLGSSMARGVGK